MKLIGMSFLFALTLSVPSPAQEKPFDYHSNGELQQKAIETMTKAIASPAGSAGEKIATYSDHAITIAARVKSGGPEVHEQWTDVIMVTGGEATLVIGGKIVGEAAAEGGAPGEKRGTSITGGTAQVVKKGDIVNIPAGTPHWIKIAPEGDFRYVNVKVKRQ
jgi:mannose-6-phosphate isomerase-like protein (cupin superfamily)